MPGGFFLYSDINRFVVAMTTALLHKLAKSSLLFLVEIKANHGNTAGKQKKNANQKHRNNIFSQGRNQRATKIKYSVKY